MSADAPREGVLLPLRAGQEIGAALMSGAFLGFVLWGWIDILSRGTQWKQPVSAGEALFFLLIGMAAGTVSLSAFVGALWRLIDRADLARFDDAGLHCHPSIGPETLAWSEMAGSRYGVARGRYGTIAYVEIDLTQPWRSWYLPLLGKRLRIGFGRRSDLARKAARIIRQYRLEAGWKR